MADEVEHSTPIPSWWIQIPPTEKAKYWEKIAPGSADRILEQTYRQVRHMRRLAWAKISLSFLGILCAFASVALFVWLAKYYADHGAPTQGAMIITALAAVVAAFVGSRAIVSRRSRHASQTTIAENDIR